MRRVARPLMLGSALLFLGAVGDRLALVDRLAEISGSFRMADGVPELAMELPTDGLAKWEDPHQALLELVACMDDRRPSQVLLDNRPVPLGMVCYEALSRVVYYEHPDKNGDIDPDWHGYVLPGDSIRKLKKAKAAWQKVVNDRAYVWP